MVGIRDQIALSLNALAGFIQKIDKITDDLHYLALNAQIEASRAGEHGRGFALGIHPRAHARGPLLPRTRVPVVLWHGCGIYYSARTASERGRLTRLCRVRGRREPL